MKWIGTYILKGKTPIPCSVMEWAEWLEKADRRVALTETSNGKISTVFLGIDHGFYRGSKQLFETMVFGGTQDELIRRSATWEEAMAIHTEVVKLVLHKTDPSRSTDMDPFALTRRKGRKNEKKYCNSNASKKSNQ